MEMLAKRRHPGNLYTTFAAADPVPPDLTISNLSTKKSLDALAAAVGVDVAAAAAADAPRDGVGDGRVYSDAYFADDDRGPKRPRTDGPA